MSAPPFTRLDAAQAVRGAFDEATGRWRVDATLTMGPSTQEVIIDHANDSIRIGDGTDLVTTTTVGGDVGLDVHVVGTVEGSFTPHGLTIAGKITTVTLNTSTWVALPASPLVNRNTMSIQNRSGQEVKMNYDNTVIGYNGVIIPDGYERQYDITDSIIIYAKSSTGSATVIVEEIA